MSSLWVIIWDIRIGNAWAKVRGAAVLLAESMTVVALLLSFCCNGLASDGQRENPNRLIVNPDGDVDSAGIPTLGDIFDFIDKNPDKAMSLIQDTGQWPYLTVAAGIIASHDAVMANGGRPIPAHLRKTLRRWYPDDMLNTVRWTSVHGPIKQFLQDAQMKLDADTLAITVMNAVIFRNDDLANDGALWAHELYHVQQYRQWGVFGFAKRWVVDSSVSGPIEAPAYAREAEARPFFAPR